MQSNMDLSRLVADDEVLKRRMHFIERARQSSNLLGTQMRHLRHGACKSLKEVAGRLSISIPYLSDVERGRRNPLSLHKLALFVDVCDCPDELSVLEELAAADQGFVSIPAENKATRRVLVSLNRTIESHNGCLSEEVADKIEKLLSDEH